MSTKMTSLRLSSYSLSYFSFKESRYSRSMLDSKILPSSSARVLMRFKASSIDSLKVQGKSRMARGILYATGNLFESIHTSDQTKPLLPQTFAEYIGCSKPLSMKVCASRHSAMLVWCCQIIFPKRSPAECFPKSSSEQVSGFNSP